MRAQRMLPLLRQGVASVGIIMLASVMALRAQETVTGQVEISRPTGGHGSAGDASSVVVWLTPMDSAAVAAPRGETPQLVQRNKTFEPHVLVVQAGSPVEFPNEDPFLHNVFSLFDGKRFDLGFYEAGSSRTVHFDRPGVSYLFCNIHPEMSAVVVAVDSPFFAESDRAGHVTIRNVPAGRYRMQVWYERSLADDLKAQTRDLTISDGSHILPAIHLSENPNFSLAHKNKYGQDYAPPGLPRHIDPIREAAVDRIWVRRGRLDRSASVPNAVL